MFDVCLHTFTFCAFRRLVVSMSAVARGSQGLSPKYFEPRLKYRLCKNVKLDYFLNRHSVVAHLQRFFAIFIAYL